MKNLFFILIFLLLVNCKSIKKSNNLSVDGNCIENLDFKNEYFYNIKIIDSLIEKNQNTQFSRSLKFMSNYSHVSFESTLNYARLYPIGAYERDRKGWLDWYEKNKCYNIQFKK
jgi:hypothetical protein